MKQNRGITLKTTHQFLDVLFSGDVHAKRIYSLANATLGVISTASLAVNTIGQGLALARGRLPKHTIKQVDRPSVVHGRARCRSSPGTSACFWLKLAGHES